MPESERTLPEERIRLPEIDVRASAGAGAIHEGFEETGKIWCFPGPFIRYEFRVRPADLRAITVHGDSKEPLLSSGDRIMIDTSHKVSVPPGVFVIWDDLGVVAKRIEHLPRQGRP